MRGNYYTCNTVILRIYVRMLYIDFYDTDEEFR